MKTYQCSLHEDYRVLLQDDHTGDEVYLDAPKEVGGLDEKLGPTDHFAASLGSCVLIVMQMRAKKLGLDLTGAHILVGKVMVNKPSYRVGRLSCDIHLPFAVTDEQQAQLEQAATHCPVHQSLHPDIEQSFTFHWGVD